MCTYYDNNGKAPCCTHDCQRCIWNEEDKDELLKDEPTIWLMPDKCRDDKPNQMYIAYQPGYPLMISSWKVGRGFVDVRTNETIQPVYLFRFTPPKA